jgi:putative ABC transport system permease protein
MTLTLAAGRVGAALLFGLKSYDPPTLAVAAAIIAFMGGVASYVPAWRATRVNLASALRNE